MTVRAGVLVTGTEILTGRVSDRNGPWLAEQLLALGVDVSSIVVAGDRPEEIEAALRFLRGEGVDLVVTSGGLGPTADDLTAAVVGRFQGRSMILDEALEERIEVILRPLMPRWPAHDPQTLLHSNRKQATIPQGAEILEPVGTAPGLVVAPATNAGGPLVVVLPGPPRELQQMWSAALLASPSLASVLAETVERRSDTLRLYGIPESEIAATLRAAQEAGIALSRMEITTCLRRGEVEVVTRYDRRVATDYQQLAAFIRDRHGATLFSQDGASVDEQVFRLLSRTGATIAVAESCTGGLLCARLTERPGSSQLVRGGLVVYSDQAKIRVAGVNGALIAEHGAVSARVAEALSDGARERLDADVGVGVTGVAGPGGATETKPIGLVCFSVSHRDGRRMKHDVTLPGGRAAVRDRSTTEALHLVRRLLLSDQP